MKSSYKKLFPRAGEVTYLDTAAEGLPAPGVAESFAEYCRDKSQGTPGRKRFHQVEEETRALAARLLGSEPRHVTFLGSASEAFTALAGSIDFRPGDEVIISDLEFPSNVLPWLRLRQSGVQVRLVPARAGALRFEDVAERISSRTRLISLSLVSYKTGAYLPFVPRLAVEAQRVGAVISIDVTQALGRIPVSLDGIDYLMSSSFKWLLGPHGLGIVYVSPRLRERINPVAIGWYSVPDCFQPDRFENYRLKEGAACLSSGMPNFPSLYALRRALEFVLAAGVERIHDDIRPVVKTIRDGIAEMGLPLLTPASAELASGVVAFEHPDAARIGAELRERNVIVWAGDGRVRASAHLYNDLDDAARYLEALRIVIANEAQVRAGIAG
jgi:selenocysteine lyase/cysteine desulfurase